MKLLNLLLLTSSLGTALATDLYSHSWQALAEMPYAASDLTATTVGSRIYLVGGCSNDQIHIPDWGGMYVCSETTNRTLAYSPATDTYTELADAPRNRYRHAAAAVGTKLYIFGGKTLFDDTIPEVDVLDTATNTWTTLADLMPSAASDSTAFVLDGKIFIVGGYDPAYNALTQVVTFDPATETFATAARGLNTARGDVGSAVVDGTPYVFGGFTHENDFKAPHPTLEVYNPSTETWEEHIEPAGIGRGDKAVVALHSRFLVMGGETKDSAGHSLPLTEVEAFAPARSGENTVGGGEWTEVGKLSEERFRFAAAVLGDAAYVFGGQGYLVGEANSNTSYYDVVSTASAYNEQAFSMPGMQASLDTLQADDVADDAKVDAMQASLDKLLDDHDAASTTAVVACVFGVLGFVLGAGAVALAMSAKGSAAPTVDSRGLPLTSV